MSQRYISNLKMAKSEAIISRLKSMLLQMKNCFWIEEKPLTEAELIEIERQKASGELACAILDYAESRNEKACFYPETVGDISMLLPAESMLCDPKYQCRIWKIDSRDHQERFVAMVFIDTHATSFCCQKDNEAEAVKECIRQINVNRTISGRPRIKAINIKREV